MNRQEAPRWRPSYTVTWTYISAGSQTSVVVRCRSEVIGSWDIVIWRGLVLGPFLEVVPSPYGGISGRFFQTRDEGLAAGVESWRLVHRAPPGGSFTLIAPYLDALT